MPRLLIDATPVVAQAKGVGRYALNLCLQLGAQLPEDWSLHVMALPEGIEQFPPGFRGVFMRARKTSELAAAMFALKKHVAVVKPDLLLKTQESAGQGRGVPTVTVCHDIDELIVEAQRAKASVLRSRLDAWKRRLRRRALQASDFVVCNSEFTRKGVQDFYQIPLHRTAVAYCAVDPRFYGISREAARQQVRKRYGVESYVLAFATGDPRENFALLPAIAARLAKGRLKTCVLIAGMRLGTSYAADLRRRFVDLGLTEGEQFKFERFLGADRFDELAALYAGADFYLELSLHEGFGMQLAEAMACGATCISSPNGALAEVGSQYAVFIDPANADEVAAAIESAYAENLHRRDNADQIAYTRKFCWEETGKVVADVLARTYEAHRP